jgi:hypothetical protein
MKSGPAENVCLIVEVLASQKGKVASRHEYDFDLRLDEDGIDGRRETKPNIFFTWLGSDR